MKPNDKPTQTDEVYEDPRLFIVIDDKKLPKPGLETAFVDYPDGGNVTANVKNNSSTTIGSGVNRNTIHSSDSIVCSCNKVRVATISCGCVGYNKQPCNCFGHVNRCSHCSHGGCRCAPVH